TQLKTTFGVIMLALVDGRPVQLDLKDALSSFVGHRLDVIKRRAEFELVRSEDRAHVLEGLLTALDDIDRVIELIRASTSPKAAADRLCIEFGLSERQAEAILAMRLARLTQLERRKLKDELEQLAARIEELRHLVERDEVRRNLLRQELSELAARYGDVRRTEILDEHEPFPLPTGSGGESSLVMLTRRGYVKSQSVRGSGDGVAGAEAMEEREGDFVTRAFVARGDTQLLCFTSGGSVHAVPVRSLPQGTRSSRGKPLQEFVDLDSGDTIAGVLPVNEFESDRFVLVVTAQGQVKRTPLDEYSNVRAGGIRATGLGEDDEVLSVHLTRGTGDVLLATRHGQVIRFGEDEVRPMGRSARGVRGIELDPDDSLVGALLPRRDASLMIATENGHAKRVPLTEVRRQGRAGKGIAILPERGTSGDLVGVLETHPGDMLGFEVSGTEVVPVEADSIREKTRRGASSRIPSVTRKQGPVTAVYPRRWASVSDPEISTDEPDSTERLRSAGVAELDALGQVELELEPE
ncbi:MAG: DNA gyrase C-terminal beta-propeller domain-containing protein, partial [Gemmatimonadota bacterium]